MEIPYHIRELISTAFEAGYLAKENDVGLEWGREKFLEIIEKIVEDMEKWATKR